MTHWSMPLTSAGDFIAMLQAGWTCFRHNGRFWLTQRFGRTRRMIPVPDWIVDHAIVASVAIREGVRLTPTFTYLQRRSA